MNDNTVEQDALFNKIRGLLRKAESSTFEEEANSFFQKAQELMLRYQIDEAALWESDPEKRQLNKIEQQVFKIDDKQPGAVYRRIILNRISQLSNCKMWYVKGENTSVVCGYRIDLAYVDMLYTSIISQAGFKMAMAQAMSTTNVRTFRNNWWRGYCEQITARLKETYHHAIKVVEDETGNSTALALLDRKSRVDAYVKEHVGLLTTRRTTYAGKADHGARAAGKLAADMTDISGGRRAAPKPKGALNG